MVTAPAKRELVRWMVTQGLSERRCLGVVGMSASALRYEPRPDRNIALRAQIVALAQRHRRYGVGDVVPEFRTVWSWTKLALRFPTSGDEEHEGQAVYGRADHLRAAAG